MVYRSLQMVEFVKKSLGPRGGAVIGAAKSSAGCGDSDSEVEGEASESWWTRLCENKHLTEHSEFYRVRGTTPPLNALTTPNPALSWRRCSPICQTCATVVGTHAVRSAPVSCAAAVLTIRRCKLPDLLYHSIHPEMYGPFGCAYHNSNVSCISGPSGTRVRHGQRVLQTRTMTPVPFRCTREHTTNSCREPSPVMTDMHVYSTRF